MLIKTCKLALSWLLVYTLLTVRYKHFQYSNNDFSLHFVRQPLSQTQSYSILTNNLKLFAQFARLVFKAQIAKKRKLRKRKLLCKCATQIAQPWKNKPLFAHSMRKRSALTTPNEKQKQLTKHRSKKPICDEQMNWLTVSRNLQAEVKFPTCGNFLSPVN